MSNLHKAFNDAKSAGALVERPPVDPNHFKTKPKKAKKPSSWKSMLIHEKLRWIKIHGPTSNLPVSVEIAQLINEGKTRLFLSQLTRSELIKRGGILRVLISPSEFVLLQQRIIDSGLKHSEKVALGARVRLEEIDQPQEVDCDDFDADVCDGEYAKPDNHDESEYDPSLEMNRRVYGGLRKIRASHLSRLNCKVQIIVNTGGQRGSFQFSGILTYECLLSVLTEIKTREEGINNLRTRVDNKHIEVVERRNPLRAGRLVHDIDVPCDPCFNQQ